MFRFFSKKRDGESFPENLLNAISDMTTFQRPRKITRETLVSVDYALSLLDSFSERVIRDLYENHLTHKEIAVRTLSNEKEIRLIEAEALRSLSNYKNLDKKC